MSRCKQCNIEIMEPTERCPLCNSVLEKSDDLEAMYPEIHQKARKFTMTLRIYSFLAITVELILFTTAFFGKTQGNGASDSAGGASNISNQIFHRKDPFVVASGEIPFGLNIISNVL